MYSKKEHYFLYSSFSHSPPYKCEYNVKGPRYFTRYNRNIVISYCGWNIVYLWELYIIFFSFVLFFIFYFPFYPPFFQIKLKKTPKHNSTTTDKKIWNNNNFLYYYKKYSFNIFTDRMKGIFVSIFFSCYIIKKNRNFSQELFLKFSTFLPLFSSFSSSSFLSK